MYSGIERLVLDAVTETTMTFWLPKHAQMHLEMVIYKCVVLEPGDNNKLLLNKTCNHVPENPLSSS